MAAMGSSVGRLLPVNMAPRPEKARTALRHCRPTASSDEVTMHETPPHSAHCTRSW